MSPFQQHRLYCIHCEFKTLFQTESGHPDQDGCYIPIWLPPQYPSIMASQPHKLCKTTRLLSWPKIWLKIPNNYIFIHVIHYKYTIYMMAAGNTKHSSNLPPHYNETSRKGGKFQNSFSHTFQCQNCTGFLQISYKPHIYTNKYRDVIMPRIRKKSRVRSLWPRVVYIRITTFTLF